MNWDQIEGGWKRLKGKVRQQWADLTEDDVDQIAGKKDELIGKLQQRKGIEREQAEREVREWSETPERRARPERASALRLAALRL